FSIISWRDGRPSLWEESLFIGCFLLRFYYTPFYNTFKFFSSLLCVLRGVFSIFLKGHYCQLPGNDCQGTEYIAIKSVHGYFPVRQKTWVEFYQMLMGRDPDDAVEIDQR